MRAERARAARIARELYLRWLELRYGRRGVPWSLHDEPIRIDPRVRHLLPSSAEPVLFEYLRHLARPGDVVLDAGGFLGAYALIEARWVGPSGRVVMIEPSPWSAAVAREHLRMNPEGSRVTLIEAAVGSHAGRVRLAVHEEPYRNQVVRDEPEESWPGRDEPEGSYHAGHEVSCHTVRAVTIDTLCREIGITPTLIRMDVQGAELEALEGARDTIAAGRGTLRIVVETHPQLWPAFGLTIAGARARLASLGLRARPLEGEDPFASDGHAILEYVQ